MVRSFRDGEPRGLAEEDKSATISLRGANAAAIEAAGRATPPDAEGPVAVEDEEETRLLSLEDDQTRTNFISSEAHELVPGATVGEYQIVQKIGAGAMGVVYAAVHPLLLRRAAIKVILPSLRRRTAIVERFVQEARAICSIRHPNIVDVFSFGALPDGRCYYLMELLEGRSLADRMAGGGPVPLPEALDILDQVADALLAAHEAGVVHRDLNPKNVFLTHTPSGRHHVKLLDFGIARVLTEEPEDDEPRTQTGILLGTPSYISPEQTRSPHHVDFRTDVYSLGVMAFALILGRLPFESESWMEVVIQHVRRPPPLPSSIWPGIPPALEALILGMLAKAPAERPSLFEARAVFAALQAPPPPALAPGPRIWPIVALVGAAAVGVAIAVALSRDVPGGGAPPSPVAPAPLDPATARGGAGRTAPPPRTAPALRGGTLVVHVDDPAARVELDGRVIADRGHDAQVAVEVPGRHTVMVTIPGRPPFVREVQIGDGALVEVDARAAAIPAAGALEGTGVPTVPGDAAGPGAPGAATPDEGGDAGEWEAERGPVRPMPGALRRPPRGSERVGERDRGTRRTSPPRGTGSAGGGNRDEPIDPF